MPCCPDCHAQVVDKDGVPLLARDLARRKRRYAECGSALWQADRTGPKRYPLADYVKHRLRGFFDLLVGDEVHEYKAEPPPRASPPASSPTPAANRSA